MWIFAFLVLVDAKAPPCLDSSERVKQVNSLVSDGTVARGFNDWQQARVLASYLYRYGVAPSSTGTAWLGIGYPNGNFISLEDCFVPENASLERCIKNPYRFAVQLLSPGILSGNSYVHGWPFNPATSQIADTETNFIYTRKDLYNVTTRAWYPVTGWSELYDMQNGKQGRTYGNAGENYTIASVFAVSEGVCPDGIQDYKEPKLSAGAIAGIVIGSLVFLCCICCCYKICKHEDSDVIIPHNPLYVQAVNNNSVYDETQGVELGGRGQHRKLSTEAEQRIVHDMSQPSAVVYDQSLEYVYPPPAAAPAAHDAPAYVLSLDGSASSVYGVDIGLQHTLDQSGFTEDYMSNLAPVSFPESDYVERLGAPWLEVCPSSAYSSCNPDAPPPAYY